MRPELPFHFTLCVQKKKSYKPHVAVKTINCLDIVAGEVNATFLLQFIDGIGTRFDERFGEFENRHTACGQGF